MNNLTDDASFNSPDYNVDTVERQYTFYGGIRG